MGVARGTGSGAGGGNRTATAGGPEAARGEAFGAEDASQDAGRGTGVTARGGGREGSRDAFDPVGDGECVADAGRVLSGRSSANSRVARGRS
jgi:hypothetical protein